MSDASLRSHIEEVCHRHFGHSLGEATDGEAYRAVCLAVRELLASKRQIFWRSRGRHATKDVHQISMECMVGTSLKNHLFHLGMEEAMERAVAASGKALATLYAMEPDAVLGVGEVGHAVFSHLEAAASLGLSCTGFSLRYESGRFRQRVVNGWQTELPDECLTAGSVWQVSRSEDAVSVRFGGEVTACVDEEGCYRVTQEGIEEVMAIPHDVYVSGYRGEAVNVLTLWEARPSRCLESAFCFRGKTTEAAEREIAAAISQTLCPAAYLSETPCLCLKQRYFLASASLQAILRSHLRRGDRPETLPQRTAIHLNGVDAALCVPELMRLLLDECHMDWERAWHVTCQTLTYTEYTVTEDAVASWDEALYARQLPRIYSITQEIQRHLSNQSRNHGGNHRSEGKKRDVITNGEVRMEALCFAACHGVNRQSQAVFFSEQGSRPCQSDCEERGRWTQIPPGIAHHRWLRQANPTLTALLTELLGDGFLRDSGTLEELLRYQEDSPVKERLNAVKRENKRHLATFLAKTKGIRLDPDSLFDMQIRPFRLQERQLLNVLHVLHRYLVWKEEPAVTTWPHTWFFVGRAAAGYGMAKQVLRLVMAASRMLEADPTVRDRLRIVFLEDYRVSLAERILPAADLSEQITVAGSGRDSADDLRLMLNGAVTIGTLDGNTARICQQVGRENLFLFGLRAHQVEARWREGYDPMTYVKDDPSLRAVIDWMKKGIGGERFDELLYSLFRGERTPADPGLCAADFGGYVRAQEEVSEAYGDRMGFAKRMLVHIAKAGSFSATHAVQAYADVVWQVRRP